MRISVPCNLAEIEGLGSKIAENGEKPIREFRHTVCAHAKCSVILHRTESSQQRRKGRSMRVQFEFPATIPVKNYSELLQA